MEKRQAFGKLINLLHTLGVTQYIHIPAVSNAYNLYRLSEEDNALIKYFRDKK